MGYVKQDFKSGEKLFASQLNAMDEQIARNEAALEEKQPKGDYPTVAEMNDAIANAQLGGEDVDLSGYLTESKADGKYQPKGDYLPASTKIPSKVSELANDKPFATESFVTTKIEEAQLGGGGNVDTGASAKSALRGLYYGFEFTDVTEISGTEWYYTPSERENATVDGITYDCPSTVTNAYGFAMANTTGLSLIRNKPINRIRFRLGPDETRTSGSISFAVMPINGSSYSHFIEKEFTESDIKNGWVTLKLDEPITIGDNETFVIKPQDSEHTPSDIKIAILRASVAATSDKYMNTYYKVPSVWSNDGNYVTRLGLCVDLGYSSSDTKEYTPNFDPSSLSGGYNNTNLTDKGYAPAAGYSNSVVINKYYVCDDIYTSSLVRLTDLDCVLAYSSKVRTDGAGGRSVGSLVKFDFANKKLIICGKTDGSKVTSDYVSIDASSVIKDGDTEYVLTVGRKHSRVFASLSNYKTGETVEKIVEDISASDFSPVGRFYDYLTFSQISGSQAYWVNLYTYVPTKVKFAFLGDSITQGIYLESVSDSWVNQVSAHYGNCVSSGRGGAKAQFMIDALNDGLVEAFSPQYVVVTIGTNGDTTSEKLQTIVEKIKEIGSIPIINCVSQTKDGKTTGDEQTIASVNEMILKLRVIGARFDIATGNNNNPTLASNDEYMQDEVHPNKLGHTLMAERFRFDTKGIN